jgi:hypothetical protein
VGAVVLDEVEARAGAGVPEAAGRARTAGVGRVDAGAALRGRSAGAGVPDRVPAGAGVPEAAGGAQTTGAGVFDEVRAGAGVSELVEAVSMVGVVIVAPGAPVRERAAGPDVLDEVRAGARVPELVGAATVDLGPPDRKRAAGAEVVALEMGQFRWGAHGGGGTFIPGCRRLDMRSRRWRCIGTVAVEVVVRVVRGEHSSDHPGAGARWLERRRWLE